MAFGTIIVKDSNGNIRKFTPNFDISEYITTEEVNQLIQNLPASLTGITPSFDDETSVITLSLSKSDNTSSDVTIDLDNLVTTAVINKIEEYNENNIVSIVPSIENDETNGLVLILTITNNNGDTDTVSASFQNLIEDILDTLPVYTPATDESNSVPGLVPSATSEQVNSILTGGGWKSIDELGINTDLSNSNLECTFETVKQDVDIRIRFADSTDFIDTEEISESLNATETFETQFTVSSTDIIGCSYSYPNNSIVPQSMTERTFSYYQDLTCWENDKHNDHYTVTFENGYTIDSYITEVTANETTIKVTIYGPKVNSPRQFLLNVDGNTALYRYNMLDTGEAEYEINAQDISVYQRTSENTQVYDGEDLSLITPVLLSSTPYTNDYLPVILERTATGIKVTGKEIDITDWPTELASSTLHIVQSSNGEDISTDIDMDCLGGYVSSSLAKLDSDLNDEKDARINAFGILSERIDNIVKEVSVTDTLPTQASTASLDLNSIILYEESSTDAESQSNSNVVTVTGNVLDVSRGYYFVKTVTENAELSFSNAQANRGYTINLLLIGGGNYTITWDSSIIWNNNTAPTLGQKDFLTFITFDGGLSWLASQRFSN